MQQGVDISLQYVDSKFKLERGGGGERQLVLLCN